MLGQSFTSIKRNLRTGHEAIACGGDLYRHHYHHHHHQYPNIRIITIIIIIIIIIIIVINIIVNIITIFITVEPPLSVHPRGTGYWQVAAQ